MFLVLNKNKFNGNQPTGLELVNSLLGAPDSDDSEDEGSYYLIILIKKS